MTRPRLMSGSSWFSEPLSWLTCFPLGMMYTRSPPEHQPAKSSAFIEALKHVDNELILHISSETPG